MSKYYYKYRKTKNLKQLSKAGSLLIFLIGIVIVAYIFFPIISWQVYFAPVFASNDITVPIPKSNIVDSGNLDSIISSQVSNITGTDYSNAQTWFPNLKIQNSREVNNISSFNLSIPKLGIKSAVVSTIDYDLSSHLVDYGGTAIPPDTGNAVIFGHSTLPQWFDPTNYKAIFATAYKLNLGDKIFATVSGVTYQYVIDNITVVNPDNTSIFNQDVKNSYITLVTCTPPGTTWKRLIIKARLTKI